MKDESKFEPDTEFMKEVMYEIRIPELVAPPRANLERKINRMEFELSLLSIKT